MQPTVCIACIYPTYPILAIYAPTGQTPRENANMDYTAGGSVVLPSVYFLGLHAGAVEHVMDVCDRMESAPRPRWERLRYR